MRGGQYEARLSSQSQVFWIAGILCIFRDMPMRPDFERELSRQIDHAQSLGRPYLDVNSGELHRDVGGYPGRDHRMPVCCDVMTASMKASDRIVSQPEKGRGASLTIRYQLPR